VTDADEGLAQRSMRVSFVQESVLQYLDLEPKGGGLSFWESRVRGYFLRFFSGRELCGQRDIAICQKPIFGFQNEIFPKVDEA